MASNLKQVKCDIRRVSYFLETKADQHATQELPRVTNNISDRWMKLAGHLVHHPELRPCAHYDFLSACYMASNQVYEWKQLTLRVHREWAVFIRQLGSLPCNKRLKSHSVCVAWVPRNFYFRQPAKIAKKKKKKHRPKGTHKDNLYRVLCFWGDRRDQSSINQPLAVERALELGGVGTPNTYKYANE